MSVYKSAYCGIRTRLKPITMLWLTYLYCIKSAGEFTHKAHYFIVTG